MGLGENVAVVVLFGWAGGARWQLGRFERVDQVHFCEDWGWRDEIELLLRREYLHFRCVEFGELCLRQVVHDAGAERVAHHIDGGTHSVTGWTNSVSISERNNNQELRNTNALTLKLKKLLRRSSERQRFLIHTPPIRHLTHSSQSTAMSRLMS